MQEKLFKEYRDLVREAEQASSLLRALKKAVQKDKAVIRQISVLENRVVRLKRNAADKAMQVTRLLEGCKESAVRQILIYRYINGYSWDKVAYRMGSVNSGDGVRKIAARYFEKSKKERKEELEKKLLNKI